METLPGKGWKSLSIIDEEVWRKKLKSGMNRIQEGALTGKLFWRKRRNKRERERNGPSPHAYRELRFPSLRPHLINRSFWLFLTFAWRMLDVPDIGQGLYRRSNPTRTSWEKRNSFRILKTWKIGGNFCRRNK